LSHGNARLTVHGRLLIVQRHQLGWKRAHIAAAMGVSRKCVKTWIDRFYAEGIAGLHDRSSRPHSVPTKTTAEVEGKVVELRRRERRGPDWIAAELGVPSRTVSRILRRHRVPYLRECDPLTGEVIRASKTTAVRYERSRPGELVHMDVKKLGRIPDGGGWRARGPAGRQTSKQKQARIGYDYIHSVIDDHSRLAYSEILADEKGPTCAALSHPSHRVLRPRRHSSHRAIDDRQRLGLPLLTARGLRCSGHRAEVHQSTLPVAERQDRALQPNPHRRVGLSPRVHQ
jgi:transposase